MFRKIKSVNKKKLKKVCIHKKIIISKKTIKLKIFKNTKESEAPWNLKRIFDMILKIY